MSVTARNLDNLRVEIRADSHTLIADEPAAAGGNDSGPNPYGLFLAALGACKIMTVELYARRKGWKLEGVDVSLDIRREYARDCEECTSEGTARVDIIECSIAFRGDLSEEQRQRLKYISERCPVHQTLVTETVIRTSLKE